MRGDALAGVDQLVLPGIAAEAEADRRTRFTIIKAKGAKHMTRSPGTACAGASERKGDVPQVSNKPRCVNALPADVQIAVVAVRSAAVDDPAGPERIHCRLPELLHVIIIE